MYATPSLFERIQSPKVKFYHYCIAVEKLLREMARFHVARA